MTEPWPTWKKVAAYVILAALALVSIWVVDRKVHRPTPTEGGTPAAR